MGLTIVGGIYVERAEFPKLDEIYGSGGRAAAALGTLEDSIELVSYVGADLSTGVEHLAKNEWGASLEAYPVPETVKFSYYHGLSTPVIRPTRLPFPRAPHIRHTAQNVLQFGMLEGPATVEADRVVYDPQNPESPERFHNGGSRARELAYVLNCGEARLITGADDPKDAAQTLLADQGVQVVIIKAGADGATVYTKNEAKKVAAYETDNVWPIGSGDVFAAVFAHFWLTEERSPFEAARLASRGAAIYCGYGGGTLPLRGARLEPAGFPFPELHPARKPQEAKIYVAGPFFTMGQLWLVEEARDALRSSGFQVFSPYHEVGIGEADEVVPQDLEAINKANVLLALCDGHDPGTLFEAGYAVSRRIPVVAFGEQTTDDSMKMLRGSGCKVLKDFTSAIYHSSWDALK